MTPAARARRAAIAADLAASQGSQCQIAERHGVSQQLVSLVARALAAETPQPLTRDVISKQWHKQTLNRAGLRSSLRLHDLRHSAATQWLIKGESLYFVQQQLGHPRIDTTTIYTKLAARDRLEVHAGVAW